MKTFLGAIAVVAVGILFSSAAPTNEDFTPSIHKRSNDERQFCIEFGRAIQQTAHPTAKEVLYVSHEIEKIKEGRVDYIIKMTYKGILSQKVYHSTITMKIDTGDAKSWEVLNVIYDDDNNVVKYNARNVQEIIKKMNR